MRLTGCQSRPAIDAAIYRPNGTLYQLQSSFHTSSTEPEPTARARRAGEEFYSTTPEFMFVSFRSLVVDCVLSTSAIVSPIKGSVRAARIDVSESPRLGNNKLRNQTCEYQRRSHPDVPSRRRSIHNRPTCPYSADDCAETEHQKGPRPVVYKVNLLFRRFSCGTGQITGLSGYYIAPRPHDAPRGSARPRAHYLANSSKLPGPATISACTITMDHDAIICSMIDRLARGPDQDVHVPSVVGPKYPSHGVDVIYF